MLRYLDVRNRHDGTRRGPWNEVECGDHYVRPMASWTLLLQAAGVCYDATQGRLTVAPRLASDTFRTFFITGSGWGVCEQNGRTSVTVDYGSVQLRELRLPKESTAATVEVNGKVLAGVETTEEDGVVVVRFAQSLLLAAGDTLHVD